MHGSWLLFSGAMLDLFVQHLASFEMLTQSCALVCGCLWRRQNSFGHAILGQSVCWSRIDMVNGNCNALHRENRILKNIKSVDYAIHSELYAQE